MMGRPPQINPERQAHRFMLLNSQRLQTSQLPPNLVRVMRTQVYLDLCQSQYVCTRLGVHTHSLIQGLRSLFPSSSSLHSQQCGQSPFTSQYYKHIGSDRDSSTQVSDYAISISDSIRSGGASSIFSFVHIWTLRAQGVDQILFPVQYSPWQFVAFWRVSVDVSTQCTSSLSD